MTTLSAVMLNNPFETLLWTGLLSFLLEGLMIGFIRSFREDLE